MKSSKYKVVICPPCGEQSLAPEGFNPGVAVAAKEGQNRKNALWPLLPRVAVLPPQGREMFHGFTQSCHPEFISGASRYNNKMLKQVQHDGIKGFTRSVTPQGRYAGYSGRMGFTLIELLIVVLIIGILAAVALPQYQKAVEKAHVAEGLTILNAMDKAQQVCVLEHGQKQCGGKNFWENAPFQPPTPLRLDEEECLDTAPCFRTKAWECFSDDLLYCMRIKNEKWIGTLSIGTAYFVPHPLTCSYHDENVDFCSDIGM